MSKIRWGVLGTARIAEQQVIPAIQAAENGELRAVASRTLPSAEAFARRNGIPKAYGSYEDLLNDDEVDAVYIPLPNDLHREWSIAAARHKKHVLCEKPAALNARQMQEIADVFQTNGVFFMEAFMYPFHPQWEQVLRILNRGDLGDMTVIDSSFSFSLQNLSDFRLDASKGGGALYDVGCYCLHAIRTLQLNVLPVNVQAVAQYAGEKGVDSSLTAVLKFPSGTLAHFDCSFDTFDRQYLQIAGSKGTLTLALPFRPDLGRATLTVETKDYKEVKTFEPFNMYVREVEYFADCVVHGESPRHSLEDSIQNMKLIEMVYNAAGRDI